MNMMSNFSNRPRLAIGYVMLGIGLFLLLCNMVYAARFLYLDLEGEKAQGTLTVETRGCRGKNGGRATCYDSVVRFTDSQGAEHEFKAGLIPILWDAFSFSDSSSREVTVSYLPSYPQFAKAGLPFHLEYLGQINIAPLIFTIVGIFLVIDERKRMKKFKEAVARFEKQKEDGLIA